MRPRDLVDPVLVLAFATAGRSDHQLGLSVSGVLGTAWPFLAGLVLGRVLTLRTRRWWLEGLAVGLTTLVVGMLLRQLSGAGTAPAFVVVAGVVLVGGMVGWRGAAVLATRLSGARRKV
ncbi:DUF3054 domain-containing protein [Serinicoccus sp. LYQ131]|uniref:DUF3054 domain-containing protein n=1 Tax=Serinicoccus sp. LYQ131 TaxID=3378797 RepID=UPI0038526A53